MVPTKFLLIVLIVATQLQPIKLLERLPTTQTIDYLFPDSLKEKLESMRNQVDPDWLQQSIANYTKPSVPTVRFFLYCNRSKPKQVHELHTDDMEGLNKSCFVWKACVKILIHDYGHTHDTPCIFPQSTKDAYLEVGDCPNIIIMDYSGTTGYWNYVLAVTVGLIETRDQGAAFIEWLSISNAANLNQIHILGYSLGAQAGAVVAAQVYANTNYKVGRLTGIDPAGPCFESNLCHAIHVISPEDAKFVDIYHTCRSVFGIDKLVGHVDFDINGGICQPFCLEPACFHLTAPYFFESSIRNGPDGASVCACKTDQMSFESIQDCCDVQISFGEYIKNTTRGEYYIPMLFDKFVGPFFQAIGTCLP